MWAAESVGVVVAAGVALVEVAVANMVLSNCVAGGLTPVWSAGLGEGEMVPVVTSPITSLLAPLSL